MRRSKKTFNKKVRNATSIEKDGIKYRSKLELYTATRLDEAGIKTDYEKHKFTIQEKFTYDAEMYEPHKVKGEKVFLPVSQNVRAITYTPDFVNLDLGFIIEVKGYANDVFPIKWKMFKNHVNGKGYTLFLPSTQKQVREVVEIIKRKFYGKKNINTNPTD